MSRVIKFRAWDVRNQIMIYDAINASEIQALLTTTLDLKNPFAHFDGLKWLQFSGMVDDSNPRKEIYEGDIVLITLENGMKQYRKIVFHNGAFRIVKGKNQRNINKTPTKFLNPVMIYQRKIIVVGNKYENPELMKKIEMGEDFILPEKKSESPETI